MAEAGKRAVEALTALGYSASEAQTAVKKVTITETMTSEDVLKGALKHLAFYDTAAYEAIRYQRSRN